MCFKGYAEVNVTDVDRYKLQAFSKYLEDRHSQLLDYISSCGTYDKEKVSLIESYVSYSRKFHHLKEPLRKLKSLFESDKVFLSDDLHEAWWEIKDSDWTPINELVEHLEGDEHGF